MSNLGVQISTSDVLILLSTRENSVPRSVERSK